MSLKLNVAEGLTGLLKGGKQHYEGIDSALLKNIDAAKEISAIAHTSLGPNGMNKLLVNHLEKIFVTSDTAAIMKELEVKHPAANLLVMAAKMQEDEVGDGTNFVVTFAGELLSQAAELVRMGLHASEIVAGYEKALDKTMELLPELTVKTISSVRDKQQLEDAIRPVVASKQYGYQDILAPLVAEACLNVMTGGDVKPRISTENVRVSKIMGGNLRDSKVVRGMVVDRDTETSLKSVKKAKVAVYGCGIEAGSTETKGTVLIKDAKELLNYNKSEEKLLDDDIKSVADSGVKVVISGGSISEMAKHFLEKYGIMALKITSKWQLRRICKAVGATAMVRLGVPTAEEAGFCDDVKVMEIGGRHVTVFNQEREESAVSTILLRASTQSVLNDLERAVDDGVSCVKTLCKDTRLVPGAAATEIELARQVNAYAESCPGLDQYAIKKFAEAFEVFPRTLAENSGQVSTDVISSLYASHEAGNVRTGVEIEDGGGVADKTAEGVYDLLATKMSAIRLACEAANTILRVDQIIMSKPAGGPKPPSQRPEF